MSKRFYEGNADTLVVEQDGKLYPFGAGVCKDQGPAREVFADDDMQGYGSCTWEQLTGDGEQFVEIEHETDQD